MVGLALFRTRAHTARLIEFLFLTEYDDDGGWRMVENIEFTLNNVAGHQGGCVVVALQHTVG